MRRRGARLVRDVRAASIVGGSVEPVEPRHPVARRTLARTCARACSTLLGFDDPWTEHAVLRHLDDGCGILGVDDVIALGRGLRDVVRWRRHVGRMSPMVQASFGPGEGAIPLAEAVSHAEAWARTMPVAAMSLSRATVIRTRAGHGVVAPGPVLDALLLGPVWEGADVVEAGRVAASIDRHLRFEADWRSMAMLDEAATHVPGVTVRLAKVAGEPWLDVFLMSGHSEVGTFCMGPASHVACLCVGRPALSGNRILDELLRGRGFGGAMQSIVERATGLACVPHEVNGNTGRLSASSLRYYAKRVARGLDVGFCDRSRARHVSWATRAAASDARRRAGPAVVGAVLVALRDAMGGVIETARVLEGRALPLFSEAASPVFGVGIGFRRNSATPRKR